MRSIRSIPTLVSPVVGVWGRRSRPHTPTKDAQARHGSVGEANIDPSLYNLYAGDRNPYTSLMRSNLQYASERTQQEAESMDVVYVGLTLALFALSWGLVELCERL